MLEPIELVHEPRHLVHLLSSPEGTSSWAAGMRQEIQGCAGADEFDLLPGGQDCRRHPCIVAELARLG